MRTRRVLFGSDDGQQRTTTIALTFSTGKECYNYSGDLQELANIIGQTVAATNGIEIRQVFEPKVKLPHSLPEGWYFLSRAVNLNGTVHWRTTHSFPFYIWSDYDQEEQLPALTPKETVLC